MTHFFVDSDLLLDSESLPPDSITLTSSQIERAVQLSQAIAHEPVQWQTYLNTLGLLGFETWLQERAPALTMQPPLETELTNTAYTLDVGGFRLCLVVTGNLSDDVVSVPVEAIASPTHAAQLYVVLEVQEEQEQVLVKAWLRSDQLIQQQQLHNLQPDSDGTYSLPLTWFDTNPDPLLLYLRCLAPNALPLGSLATPPPSPLSPQFSPSPQSSPSLPNTQHPTPNTQHPTLLNTALWLRNQLDAVAQDLAWVLLPPPIASAMRSAATVERESTAAQFARLLQELNRVGVEVPSEARGAFRDLQWGGVTVRLYAITWVLPLVDAPPEWSLLLVVSTPSGDRVPAGVRLQVQDQEHLLVERSASPDAEEAYLYGRVIGTWSEQFWVTVALANGTSISLPPFSFNPDSAPSALL